MDAIILANGTFPETKKLLKLLDDADRIICCDGAVNKLVESGREPYIVIGDLDSVKPEIKTEYQDRLVQVIDQNTNDLTKAVNWCAKHNVNEVIILGATGGREDHTVGNISLLAQYAQVISVKILTDKGVFIPISKTTTFDSFVGQQVSVFTLNAALEISSTGLKYPLKNHKLKSWWMGTLNESVAGTFSLSFTGKGDVIVFLLNEN